MNKHVIIVAGGKGSRMKTDLPKQFLIVEDRPILMHTIEAFYNYDANIQIIVILPADQIVYWQEQIAKYDFHIRHKTAIGGSTRYDSVKNGLSQVADGLVAVHDGARPLVDWLTIEDAFQSAAKYGSGIASVKLKDSIRLVINNHENQSVDRESYCLIQTPQVFQYDIIRKAYENSSSNIGFTDDASVVEHLGIPVHLTAGSYENIKITSPEDLIIAEAILKARA